MSKKPEIFDIALQSMQQYLRANPALHFVVCGAPVYFYTLLPLIGQYLTLVDNNDVVVLPEFQPLVDRHGNEWLADKILSELNRKGELFEPYRKDFDRYNEYQFQSLTIKARSCNYLADSNSSLADLLADRAVSIDLQTETNRCSQGGGISFDTEAIYPFMPKRFLKAMATHVLRTKNEDYDSFIARMRSDYTRQLAPYEVKLPHCIKLEGDIATWQNFLKHCS